MKVLKKFLAIFLSVCMLMPYTGITSYAEEITEITEETTVTTEETVDDVTTEQTQVNTKENDIEDTEVTSDSNDSIKDGSNNEKNNEDTDETEKSEEETVEEKLQTLQLNYLVIENDYVETPSSQYVVASIGEEGAAVSNATLYYVNQTTGAAYTKEADVIKDFLVLFDLDFSDDSLAGQYKLQSITYVKDDNEFIINLDEQGLNALFGVDCEVDTNPSAWLVDEEDDTAYENSDDVAGVIVNDVTAGNITADDVDEALLENGFSDVKLEKPAYCFDEDWNETRVSADPASFVVVLDPGHGGGDSGAARTYNGITVAEREINLKIALACKAELEKSGVTVYLTRSDNNTSRGLTERAQIADSYGADLFVSIHNNSSTNTSATGSEVWVPNSSAYNHYAYTTGQTLGTDIITQLGTLGLTKRGVFTRNATPTEKYPTGETYPTGDISDYYTVINESRRRGIPGIIIEHAYVSNQADALNYLSSDASLNALGAADAKGILQYINSAPEGYIFRGTNYSDVFDADYYLNNNPDLKAAFGSDKNKAFKHFVTNGMSEGRQAKAEFNVNVYKNNYADLRAAFGNNLKAYYLHYISDGKREGRIASANGNQNNGGNGNKVVDTSAVYQGVDYSAVYNYDYYINKYSDVKAAFGNDKAATLAHFVNNGMVEGRQGCKDFDVRSYRNAYPDLKSAFGTNLKLYYLHYMSDGKREGRIATGVTQILYPDTVYNGVDYSAVYDFNYYISKYPDIKAAFGNDDAGALAHFVNNGMSEGRQAKANFDVKSYRNANQDLRLAFGNNLKSYYYHYMGDGKNEGRIATGVSTLQNPLTVYNGVDYSKVYDFNYYLAHNPDIKAAFGEDEVEVLAHFVNCGMNEGRQAKASFNVNYYRMNYGDLMTAYGSKLRYYYLHYMNDGYRESRVADKLLTVSVGLTPIMGNANTSAAQMAAYYKSKATYPAFYANTDAPTIEVFCQIYIEECQAEGVRADVAFCQAMKETGFLRYGGQVSIEQLNFAGLGATDGGAAGASFGSVREGIRAQVQHLKAYASTAALNNACVDTRFTLVTRNSAPYVEWLGIQENPYGKGWATATRYGYSIINDYMAKLRQY